MNDEQKSVLFALCGLSPAVITETVWALAQEEPPIIPHRIIVATTTEGQDKFVKLLRPQEDGPWQDLLKHLTADGHDLTDKLQLDPLMMLTDVHGKDMTDVVNEADNKALADFLFKIIGSLTQRNAPPLIASLAGGRKTMSSLLHTCFMLRARHDDRLTHVLVRSPFDTHTHPPFFFPVTPPTKHHYHHPKAGNTSEHSSDEALPVIVDIPFIPLRHLTSRERPVASFMETVVRVKERLSAQGLPPPRVSLIAEKNKCALICEEVKITLPKREFLLYLFLAYPVLWGNQTLESAAEVTTRITPFLKQISEMKDLPFFIKNTAREWLAPSNTGKRKMKPVNEDAVRTRLSAMRKKIAASSLHRYLGRIMPEEHSQNYRLDINLIATTLGKVSFLSPKDTTP